MVNKSKSRRLFTDAQRTADSHGIYWANNGVMLAEVRYIPYLTQVENSLYIQDVEDVIEEYMQMAAKIRQNGR